MAPLRINSTGRRLGGKPFSRGNLYVILSNPVYIGRIVHKGKDYNGQHQAIIDRALWEAVRQKMATQSVRQSDTYNSTDSFLTGKLHDDAGNRMGPNWSAKGTRRWRYYVSLALLHNKKDQAGTIKRVPAPKIEEAVIDALAPLDTHQSREPEAITALIERVVIGQAGLTITTTRCDQDGKPLIVHTSWNPQSSRRRREIIPCERNNLDANRPMRLEAHARLIPALIKAHQWLDDLAKNRITLTDLASREDVSPRTIRSALSLAFVAPDIVAAALERRLPRGFGMSRLANLPINWQQQRQALGLSDEIR